MGKNSSDFNGSTAVFLEVDEQQYDLNVVMERCKADYKANHKEKLSDIKVYVKPEDKKAYYTANNGSINGNVDL